MISDTAKDRGLSFSSYSTLFITGLNYAVHPMCAYSHTDFVLMLVLEEGDVNGQQFY